MTQPNIILCIVAVICKATVYTYSSAKDIGNIVYKWQNLCHLIWALTIEYARVFKSLLLTEVNVLYTSDIHQCEALLICRQVLLLSCESVLPVKF